MVKKTEKLNLVRAIRWMSTLYGFAQRRNGSGIPQPSSGRLQLDVNETT